MGIVEYAGGSYLTCPHCLGKKIQLKVIAGFGRICEECYRGLGGEQYFKDYAKALKELNHEDAERA